MIRVAIVTPGVGEGHVRVALAFSGRLRKLIPKLEIEDYVGQASLTHFHGVFRHHFDLVVTVGTLCTMLASKIMKEGEMTIPLLSLSANGNIVFDSAVERYQYMSGVYVEAPAEYIPLDAVFKIFGVARRVVLIYRTDADDGQIGFVVDEMKEYAAKAGVLEVISVCIAAGPLDANDVGSTIQAKDVVVPVRGGRVVEDIDTLAQICAEKGADFFSDANGKIPATAIGGYVVDLDGVGLQGAVTAFSVLMNQVAIQTIEPIALKRTTQVAVNAAMARDRGISLPLPGHVFSLDTMEQYRLIHRTPYPFIWTTTMKQEVRLFEAIYLPGKNRTPGIECIPLAIQGIHDTDEHREWVIEQTMNLVGGPFVVVGGEKMALLLQQEMLKQQKFRSMTIIKSSDDEPAERAKVGVPGWPEDRFIQRVTLEVPLAAVWLDFLQYIHPGLTRVGLIYSYEPELLPAHLKVRVANLAEECAKRGLTFVHAGRGLDHTFFELACRNLAPESDVIFSMPDMLKPRDGLFASLVCHEKGILYVSSDLARSDRAGACMGPQYGLIVPPILGTVCDATVGRVPAEIRDMSFSAEYLYGWCVNENWLKLHGLPLPAASLLQPGFTRLEAAFDPDKPFGDATRVVQLTAEKIAKWTLPAKLAIEPLTREEYMLRQQKLLEQAALPVQEEKKGEEQS